VRFVYVSSLERYLSILSFRDVIEENLPGDLDVSGWDLRKALALARKSNPPLIEWLRSPIFYSQHPVLFPRFKEVVGTCYSPERCFLHYPHMAEGNVREYLCGPEVWLKKYLYVLRPILACRWIERWPSDPVPMEFRTLLDRVVDDPILTAAVEELLRSKMAGKEIDRGPRSEPISVFIEHELHRLRLMANHHAPAADAAPLDAFFRDTILSL
jgi:predicted nucleotidyltransferase